MNSKVKYSRELLEELVQSSLSVAEVIRKLGLKQAGGNHSHITRRIVKYGIDSSHFMGSVARANTRHKPNKLEASKILIGNRLNGRRESAFRLRRALVDSGIPEQCACGLKTEWNGKKLVLQVDHKDGDFSNNRIENLRFICPNCHSQTENFGAKNRSITD